MKIIDLSHTIHDNMPVFPGSRKVDVISAANIGKDNYNEQLLNISTHTGTHIDCGRHIFQEGADTDAESPDRFFGKGLVIDCRQNINSGFIDVSYIRTFENELQQVAFVLLYTGWYHYWGTDKYNKGYPCPGIKTADYLAAFDLKGIGTDTMSVDECSSSQLTSHKILLSKGMILIENLTNLELLIGQQFVFCCFPLKIRKGDGSPVRAVGITEGPLFN